MNDRGGFVHKSYHIKSVHLVFYFSFSPTSRPLEEYPTHRASTASTEGIALDLCVSLSNDKKFSALFRFAWNNSTGLFQTEIQLARFNDNVFIPGSRFYLNMDVTRFKFK